MRYVSLAYWLNIKYYVETAVEAANVVFITHPHLKTFLIFNNKTVCNKDSKDFYNFLRVSNSSYKYLTLTYSSGVMANSNLLFKKSLFLDYYEIPIKILSYLLITTVIKFYIIRIHNIAMHMLVQAHNKL